MTPQEPAWNAALDALPDHCDVLVVGAGPAGSACAQVLARAGWQVVLADAQRFPREKTCGDGLVPDTHAALQRLGLLAEVLAEARTVPIARCVAPSGQHVDVPGELAVLPRRRLDAILCAGAVAAGAQMVAPARLLRPLRDPAGRVNGAILAAGGAERTVHCPWLVLATGAAASPIEALGLCERRSPSGMALRAYIQLPGLREAVPGLQFTWHGRLRGGYGWVFPGPDDTYNVGVGILDGRHRDAADGDDAPNLRQLFERFTEVDPIAARLVREGRMLGGLKGAPLRCDLDGAGWSAPGVLVVGDAVGATYAFSGEGIGKAMETGMAAADALLAHSAPQGADAGQADPSAAPDRVPTEAEDARVAADYRTRLEAIRPKFEMYRRATSFNRWPWLLNLVVWRASHSPRIQRGLAEILAERKLAGSLLSWRGLRRMVLG